MASKKETQKPLPGHSIPPLTTTTTIISIITIIWKIHHTHTHAVLVPGAHTHIHTHTHIEHMNGTRKPNVYNGPHQKKNGGSVNSKG